jgi:hypothetical protein
MDNSENRGKAPKSIDNFDQSGNDKPILNSPRSLEACRRQGIKPEDLIKQNKEQIKLKFKDKKFASEQLFTEFCTHIEERRVHKIEVLKKVRNEVINEEQELKSQSLSPRGSKDGAKDNMSIIEREKMMLEKLERRQNKEIQKMMEYEQKMEEMRQLNEMKSEKQREKQRKLEEEVALRRKLNEEKRVRQEEERHKKALEEEEATKKRNAELFDQELLHIKKRAEEDVERRKFIRLKEIETAKKQELANKATADILRKQEEQVRERQRQMEEREKIRIAKFEEENEARKKITKELREYHEKKTLSAKEKNDLLLEEQRKAYEKRRAHNEEKRRLFDEEQRLRLKQLHEEGIRRSEEIKQVLNNNAQMEEKKRQDYYKKLNELNTKKIEIEAQMKQEEERHMAEERAKEAKRKYVLDNNQKLLQDKIHHVMDKLSHTDLKVTKAKEKLLNDLVTKQHQHFLKKLDRQENVERISEIHNYKRHKILEKIEGQSKRTNDMRKEQENLLNVRMKIRSEMQLKKEKLLLDFAQQQKKQKMMKSTYQSHDGLALEANKRNRSAGSSVRGNDSFHSDGDGHQSQRPPVPQTVGGGTQ